MSKIFLPASAAPPVVMRTAVITPADGYPFFSTHTPIPNVTKGRHRLNTTYMGKLSPLRDQRVSVDCKVDKIQTLAKTFTNWKLKGGISILPSLLSTSNVRAAVPLVKN